jgi:chemotaxis family two-component system sensor histidine kinase/response regulator PixL
MDSYGELHSLVQATLEEIVQLEEKVGDVVLLAGQSSQTLEGQRQMLGHLRDDLMWARMLPIGELLNRFPRILRDLSTSYSKPVELKLIGTEVLIDKAALEKLYDPLLHLVRNAFDHGIEPPDVRAQQGKRQQGQIEVRAYHQGSQTIIEVRDDGRGINFDRIRTKALDLGLLSSEQLATTSTSRLLDLLFEPGFSTASQVSELSGRGVGLDVVRSQLRSLKGTVTLASKPGEGTTFTLRIPLTLTIAKLLVCFVGSNAFALPADSIEEIVIPQTDQVKQSGGRRFLHWQDQLVSAYHLSELLDYACQLPEVLPSQTLVAFPSPEDWAPPMLLLRQEHEILALEVDRLVTEQELVIKTFGAAIAPPSYIYGCTILGDGSLIPVIDGAALVDCFIGESKTAIAIKPNSPDVNEDSSATPAASSQGGLRDVATITSAPTLLVVDDSIVVRQTLALTLQKAGYRVLQARDGREGIDQMQKNSTIQLVVCDIEMPNMNGFEFLSQRRQDPTLSKTPVVMLTSRSSDKHRQLAMQLGANNYFTKPYIEQEFLAAIKSMIMQDVPVRVPALAR